MTTVAIRVRRIERLDMRFVQRAWPFMEQRRREIAAHFAERQRKNPAIWNGRVLMMTDDYAIDGAVFRGNYLETDYASFLAWQDWGRPDAGIKDSFSEGAIRTADGAFLLGVMGPTTSYPGRIYFPGGTPDPADIVGDAVDLEQSVWRELAEETGIERDHLMPEPGWFTVFAGQRIAHIKILQARDDADTLRARIRRTLAGQQHPELSDMRIVRSPADFDPMMQDFATAFLHHVWDNGG